ncbi:hypothetical protein SAMN05444166_1294 [Singulisphaera sp. GP187]|uniref:hypothetical protein n=1 Tax=Singulisphaera sp. GP187 TaxID=1882752 RepID=UPI00092B3D85|nr:hypothetical protein [Singulisphaera sp. GP187]SIN85708.1 hypothetical protein SAMN05444166_1294 [Singulisphaera sp. GP187]
MSKTELPLLNVFEVETDGVHHHLICFLDVILAGSRGIDSRSVIGQFTPSSGGAFDLETFQVNPTFIEVFVQYMNENAIHSPEIIREAASRISDWIYLLDPRTPGEYSLDPSASDLVGCFAVDDTGQIVPRSFQYNREHLWFDPVRGVSGILSDRAFYKWLHPLTDRKDG